MHVNKRGKLTPKMALIPVLATLLILPRTDAKKVLFFPYHQTSHVIQFMKAAHAVADLGHEVHACMPHSVYVSKFLNQSERIQVHTYSPDLVQVDMSYQNYTGGLYRFWHENMDQFDSVTFDRGIEWAQTINRQALLNKSFVEEVARIKADLFVIDTLPFLRSILILPYKFDIPFIFMGTHYDFISARIPISLTSTPMILYRDPFTKDTPFLQQLRLTVFHLVSYLVDPFWDPELLQAVAPEKPYISSWELTVKAELFIFETDPIVDYARPAMPNTKLIGGTSPLPARPLTNELKDFVESSPTDIVYVAFGTQGENVPARISAMMTEVFQNLPFRVIWRTYVTSPDPNKILTGMWIPQNDLLGHRKTRLYVSHCGTWSQYESIYHGVPLLCLPLLVDQFYNSIRISAKFFGKHADIRKISAENLTSLIMEVATNDTYRQSTRKASELFRRLYKLPVKEAAFWIDHVMEYGGEYMRSVGQEVPLFQFLSVTTLSFIFAALLFMIFFICLVIGICFRYAVKGKKRKTE